MTDFAAELARLRAADRYRSLNLPGGIDLSSNDYLGLSRHPALAQVAIAALQNGLSAGATGSRLLRGHQQAHAELEAFAARYFDAPRTLFFANGFQANYALITTLIDRHDVAIFDSLCHASMRDGLHASHCRSLKVRHNDLDAFEAALQKPRSGRAWVLIESVYSMEGDVAPVAELLGLCERHDAMLIVDEAHGTGVFGAHGRGVSEGLAHERLISLHTCGKALGVAGGLVCARADIIEYLINFARPFIYSTAPMPLQAVLVQKALELVRDEPERRERLLGLQGFAAERLKMAVSSPIIPILIGEDAKAVAIAHSLQQQGFDIRAIRPPTVPASTARLRLSLNAGLTPDDIAAFATALSPLLETP
ncbi:8-amino-7-oxononanoate synthase [Asticcacaulis sp. EMRT-3]|uniref:8-amino-7-oxononanoate synthase n=1 Tax=Asticcacaulis sp. EMRT-3 TaxID=3040349 RepID=UPI0024AFB2A7|nr:8-amino-7-oxononanoate synthase [Asticcacaulis sp. EMRT-3]MDI7776640.1 8-amino-7-oxononanoate synthase [Asticcacaulis sp. EMRT-3]